MRRTAVLLALFPCALALACSSSPTESVEATSQEIFVTCPVGQHDSCEMNEVTGRYFCTCAPNTCNYATAPQPPQGIVAWVAAWASKSVNGTCPVITTPTGRWAQLGDVIGATEVFTYSNGLPNDTSLANLEPGDCTQVPGMGSTCCTYVWWPNGYPAGAMDATLPAQNIPDLCPVNGETLVPLEQWGYPGCNPADAGSCTLPGGGGCATCPPVKPH
jgi:hypothetical protein